MKVSKSKTAYSEKCTAIGNSDHPLNQDSDTITISQKGVSETPTFGVRVFDTSRI